MLLAVLVVLIVAGVTYFHYLQGGFTSAMSAFSAFLATLVAFGYYEMIVVKMEPGKVLDQSLGMMLIGLFGITYLVLRIILDAAVPGNIRLPLWVDRGCAIGFGLMAGILCAGVFAIAAQLLPFGPSGGMFARYELRDRNGIIVPRAAVNARSDQDMEIHNELVKDTIEPANRSAMMLPADDLVMAIISGASDNAFAGDVSFSSIHPDLLTEAFANRLGADSGIRRVVLNGGKSEQVTLAGDGLSLLSSFPKIADTELVQLRPDNKSISYSKDNSKKLLVVRALFRDTAADSDGYLRIPIASTRLVIDGKTYYPIGTMDHSGVLALNRLDDLIVLAKDDKRGADFVFPVDASVLDKAATAGKFKPGSFVEFKLMGRIFLDGQTISADWAPSDKVGVMRKKLSPLITPPEKSDKK